MIQVPLPWDCPTYGGRRGEYLSLRLQKGCGLDTLFLFLLLFLFTYSITLGVTENYFGHYGKYPWL